MIGEYVPADMAKYSVSIFTISQSVAGVLAFSSGMILPKNTDTEALKENKTWRIIFAVPFLFFATSLFCLLVFMRHDTPKYYISKGLRPQAISAIHKVYHT